MKVGHSKTYGKVKSDNNHLTTSRKLSKQQQKLSHSRVRAAAKKEDNGHQDR